MARRGGGGLGEGLGEGGGGGRGDGGGIVLEYGGSLYWSLSLPSKAPDRHARQAKKRRASSGLVQD